MAELIIVFREVFEASLIIGIIYTYLKKTDSVSSIKMMWGGVTLAIILSILGSFLFQIFAGGFEGRSGKIFEGFVMIAAWAVLSSMIIWMARNKNITEDLKDRAKESLSSPFGIGIFSLAFISVFREGVETILFLYSVSISQNGISVIPSLIGGLIAILAGYLIFVQGAKVPIKKFFNITSAFLIFVASGMLAYGVHELESAKILPYFSGEIEVQEDSITATRLSGYSKTFNTEGLDFESKDKVIKKAKKWSSRLWDINPPKTSDNRYPAMHDKGTVGGLMKGLFGYNGDPSLIELLSWIASVVFLFYLWRNSNKGE